MIKLSLAVSEIWPTCIWSCLILNLVWPSSLLFLLAISGLTYLVWTHCSLVGHIIIWPDPAVSSLSLVYPILWSGPSCLIKLSHVWPSCLLSSLVALVDDVPDKTRFLFLVGSMLSLVWPFFSGRIHLSFVLDQLILVCTILWGLIKLSWLALMSFGDLALFRLIQFGILFGQLFLCGPYDNILACEVSGLMVCTIVWLSQSWSTAFG